MVTYRIGTRAEKTVAITVDRTGMLKTTVCHHRLDGRQDAIIEEKCDRGTKDTVLDFIVQVRLGHSGLVEILPGATLATIAHTMIPLGADRPFLESEMPPRAGSDGAFSQSQTITFRFVSQTLTWATENVSGRLELTERVPEVSVALRLPAGNAGEFIFSQHIISHTDGRRIGTLSAV